MENESNIVNEMVYIFCHLIVFRGVEKTFSLYTADNNDGWLFKVKTEGVNIYESLGWTPKKCLLIDD